MNSIHNNGDNDKSLDKGLDEFGREYGLLERDEPPELLDQAILNSAHRAVEKKPHWMKFGWLHGLTTAAVFVLAFSIILDQPETAPEYESGVRDTAPARLQRERVSKIAVQDAPYVSSKVQGEVISADQDVASDAFMFEEHKLHSTLSVAEQKIQAIIKLKQSGNETWKTELKLFKDSYPDYPLPEELKN